MKISKMADGVTPSLTRKLFNMAQEIGEDVIDLTLGDPDIPPHENIRRAASDAVINGKMRYSANAGLIELRSEYANFFKKQYGISLDPKRNVIATVGGMEALFLALASIIDPGDEVVVLAPYYVNYVQMIKMLGGTAVVVDTLNKSDERVSSDIKNAVNEKTVSIIINSPCNPTGEIISPYILDSIAKIACESDILVISDEVYNSLVYDGNVAESIITRPNMQPRTVLVDSCSKRFAMTGFRIGFAVGPKKIISAMTKMQENVAACAPVSSQYAAIEAYSESFDNSYIKETYEKRRNILVSMLDEIECLSYKTPKATFYCFVDIAKTGMDAENFCYELLKNAHVAVVPGNAYGEKYKNYIRIAFTLKEEKLIEAMKRIKDFCRRFTK